MDDMDRQAPAGWIPLLTIPEVAKRLRISKTSAQRLINGEVSSATKLEHVQIGRRKLVREDSLDRFVRAMMITDVPESAG